MYRVLALLVLVLAASCADWPDVETPRPSRAAVGWPELIPIAELPTSTASANEEVSNEILLARAAALRNRAAVLRRPVADSEAFERMRSLLAR